MISIFLRELYDKSKKFWKKSKAGAEWIWRKGELESKLNATESVTKCIEFCGGASPLYDFTNLK